MKTKELTVNAVFLAIILLMVFVPNLGFITLGPLSATIIHIPVLIVAFAYGKKSALIAGTAFGVGSWYASLTRGGVADLVFQNPLVSVLPRILFALIAVYLFTVLKKQIKDERLSTAIAAGLSTLIHTLLVIGAIYLFADFNSLGFTGGFSGYLNIIKVIILTGGILEIILAAMLVPLATSAIKRVQK